jgi:hypothetical protein
MFLFIIVLMSTDPNTTEEGKDHTTPLTTPTPDISTRKDLTLPVTISSVTLTSHNIPLTTETLSPDNNTHGGLTVPVTTSRYTSPLESNGTSTTDRTIMTHAIVSGMYPSRSTNKTVITTSQSITHTDTTFLKTSPSPHSHGDGTSPAPSSTSAPEITRVSTRDTTHRHDEISDKGIGNELDYLFITVLTPLLFITCV